MKKALLILPLLATMAACSSMKAVPERDSYAQPKWYQNCAQKGSEGFLWWSKDMVYACGAGESIHSQAAEEQMYAIAMNNFAKRINSRVNSETTLEFENDRKTTRTVISYTVDNTTIREHVRSESGQFTMAGKHYSFVRLSMPKDVFDQLLQEAKAQP